MKDYSSIFILILLLLYLSSAQQFTNRIPEYFGATYDIFSGNPLSEGIDPGFRPKQLFQYTYDKKTKTEDGKFYYPKEVNVRLVESCSRDFESTEINGMKSYHDTLKVAASASGGYDGIIASASFTASADYKRSESELSTQKKIRVTTQEKCELYSAGLQTGQKLTQDFLDAVDVALSMGSWEEFIGEWGTHYASQLVMGASMIRESVFDRETVQKMKSIGIDVAVAVSGSYGAAHGEVSVNTGLTDVQKTYFDKKNTNYHEYSIGIPLPNNADNSTWILEIENAKPLPLSFNLKFIGDLFNSKGYAFFGDKYNATQLDQMRTDFNNTVHAIATRGPQVPGSDTPVEPVHILPSSTLFVGGMGGDYFEDPGIQNIFMKPKAIEIRSADTLDAIRLHLSDEVTDQYTDWHGGGGGDLYTYDIPEGKRLAAAHVWVEGLVNGIRFVNDDGTYSQTYGHQVGTFYEIKIFGDLVGFRGRSATRVDSIGFVSNALSDTSNSTTVTVATPLYGGDGGSFFVDQLSLTAGNPHVYLRTGSRLDNIRLVVEENGAQISGSAHGGSGGDPSDISLNGLQALNIRAADEVDAVQFQISEEWTGLYGGDGGDLYTWIVPTNHTLIGVYGRSADRVDAIGFIFAKTG